MKQKQIGFLIVLVLTFLFSSCGINGNMMFKTPKGGEYQHDSIPLKPTREYQISFDDKFVFSLSTNDGQRIIENVSGVGKEGGTISSGLEYSVDVDGYAKLPVIGRVFVAGLSVSQLEDTLEQKYAQEYQDPFVQVKLTNQRVLVFPGNGGDARVVPLLNTNTTLMEAIATAGGIAERGKANTIKIMRMVDGKRKVYVVDFSTIEGLPYADMVVQANDYIYIEPQARLGREVLTQATPFISILSSALVLLTVLNRL